MEHRGMRVARWFFAALVAGLLWWLLRAARPQEILGVLRASDPALLLAAFAAAALLRPAFRVQRSLVLLKDLPSGGQPPCAMHMAQLLLASHAISQILPAPIAVGWRALRLRRAHGFALSEVIAVQLVEKVFDGLNLSVLLLLSLLWADPPTQLLWPLRVAALLLGAALVTAVLLGRCGTVARRLRTSLLFHPARALFLAWLWSALCDLSDLAALGLCLLAAGIHVGGWSWVLLFLVINLAIAVPSTPGQVGVLEGAMVLVLVGLGVATSDALAAALLYHGVHLFPVLIFGPLGLTRRPNEAAA